jgi:hypothetical protein
MIFYYYFRKKKFKVEVFKTDVKSKNEFEVLKNLITVYSCYKTMTGQKSKMLRSKLVTLLSIYIKYGYNSESKDYACNLLELKKTNLNCLNSELREGGFLIKSNMNTRDSYLNPELETLSNYYKDKNSERTLFLFNLYIDESA